MDVTCEVAGGERHELELPSDATYADLIRAVDLSPQEAVAVIDGAPVPDDAVVDADAVRVLRLIKGG